MTIKFLRSFSDRQPGGVRELLVLAVPMIISTASDGVMTFTDRFFLSQLGHDQMNASLGGGVSLQVLLFFFVGLTGYSTALVAQYFGAGERLKTTRAAFQAILVAFVSWPVVILLAPLGGAVFSKMGIPQQQMEYQLVYLNTLSYGSIFLIMRHTLGCYFMGIGKPRVVMIATLLAMFINVVLDYVLIFGKLGFSPMGVKGAAIATIMGGAAGTAILLVAYLGHKNRTDFGVLNSFKFDFQMMKKLVYFGYPAGLELFLNFVGFSITIALFHGRGQIAATATTIMFNWDLVSFIPLLGIEIAVTSLVGRYMGAGRLGEAQRAAYSAIKIGVFYSFAILLLFVFVPEFLVRVFQPGSLDTVFEDSVPIAVRMIRIASIYVLVEAMMVAMVGALRGAGDTHYTMVLSVVSHWVFIPVLYLSLNVFESSIELGWFLLVVSYLIFSTIMFRRFKSGKWKQIHVIEDK